MASLQARHSRSCALRRPWTTFAEGSKDKGCTCEPMYHVVSRQGGKLHREPVGHNRKVAGRAFDSIKGKIAEERYEVQRNIAFAAWADEWLASFSGKESTRRTYASSLVYARHVFGSASVRSIKPGDVRRFLDYVKAETPRGREASPATLAKHLRHLKACLSAAMSEGYTASNAVGGLHGTFKPKQAKQRPAYYTDAELARLWPELAYRPVYLYLCKAACSTGMRSGELSALKWGDVSLLNSEVALSRTFTAGIGLTSTKSGEPRTLDLTPQAVALLKEWYAASGSPGDDELIFPREEGGYLDNSYVTRAVLYPALERAGVPRVGERGRKRDFHSFRHSFARIALENGAEITWVQRQLGHSSIVLTVDTYGAWERKAEKVQAERLAGAFPI